MILGQVIYEVINTMLFECGASKFGHALRREALQIQPVRPLEQ